MKKVLVLTILGLLLVGCGSKNDVTVCQTSVDMQETSLNFVYEYESKDNVILKEKRVINMTFETKELADSSMAGAQFGEEKGAGYTSNIKREDDVSLSNTLTIDYEKIDETSAAKLGLEAVDGNYATGLLDEMVEVLENSLSGMTCEVK